MIEFYDNVVSACVPNLGGSRRAIWRCRTGSAKPAGRLTRPRQSVGCVRGASGGEGYRTLNASGFRSCRASNL